MHTYRCSPVDMRKNLEVVEVFKKGGIDFVAIPVGGEFTKEVLVTLMSRQLEALEKDNG